MVKPYPSAGYGIFLPFSLFPPGTFVPVSGEPLFGPAGKTLNPARGEKRQKARRRIRGGSISSDLPPAEPPREICYAGAERLRG